MCQRLPAAHTPVPCSDVSTQGPDRTEGFRLRVTSNTPQCPLSPAVRTRPHVKTLIAIHWKSCLKAYSYPIYSDMPEVWRQWCHCCWLFCVCTDSDVNALRGRFSVSKELYCGLFPHKKRKSKHASQNPIWQQNRHVQSHYSTNK